MPSLFPLLPVVAHPKTPNYRIDYLETSLLLILVLLELLPLSKLLLRPVSPVLALHLPILVRATFLR